MPQIHEESGEKSEKSNTRQQPRAVTMKTSGQFKRYAASLAGPTLVLVYLSLASTRFQTSEAFLNCFTPNMFKMGKHQQLPPGYAAAASNPGERASWYGQPTVQAPPPAYFYGRNPMSRLFGPKMGGVGGGGGGLFGAKRWMEWRNNNMNFYRPGYGYWSPQQQQQQQPQQLLTPGTGLTGYNYNTQQLADQLNLQPAYNTQVPGSNQLISGPGGYGQQQANTNSNINDGWTVPFVNPYTRPSQQLQLPYGGDGYSVSPGANQQQQQQRQQSGKQQVDSYGAGGSGTKGSQGSGGNKQQQLQQGQYGTTKNVLIANGGYASHDAHLAPRPGYAHHGFGYSYPEWYAGSVDSPAKIAQQLYRIQQQQQQRRRVMLGGAL